MTEMNQNVGDCILSDEEFMKFTRFCNAPMGDDHLRRGALLGYGEKKTQISIGALVRIPPENMGNNVLVGLYSYVNGKVTIGDDVLIGPHCSIVAGNHKFDPKTGCFSGRTNTERDDSIVIGRGCWLASNVTVTGGVRLGKANLVCAGAVVTKSMPDYAIVAGIPARQVGRIDPETGEYIWFSK